MIRTELEHYLSNELKTLLGMDADFAVDPNEDFAQYGMNSIVSARYTHLLSEAFNVELSPKQIVDYSSIGKLAAHLVETYPETLSDFGSDSSRDSSVAADAPEAAEPEMALAEEAEAELELAPEPDQNASHNKEHWVQKIVAELTIRAQKVDAILAAATRTSAVSKLKAVAAKTKQALGGGSDSQNLLDFSFIFFSTNNNKQDTVSEAGENKYSYVKNIAKYADANGFKALWMPERHFYEFGGIFPEPAVLLSNIAAETQQIRLRSGSVILPLHHPASVVESWSVLDNLSNGRVDMGFASGWNPNDFVVSPDTFHNLRNVWFSRMDEVQKLWRGEAVTYQNGKNEPVDVRVFPRPQQPELNLWVTISGNPKSFAEAGKRGHNILTMLTSKPIDELAQNIAVYRAAREEAGFDANSGVITLMLHSYVHADQNKVDTAVNEHYFQYIKSGLIGHLQAQDEQPSEDEINRMVEHSFHFQRKNSALFGTPEHCQVLLGKMRDAGVNEIACLVDFGISEAQMYETLPYLTQVKNMWLGQEQSQGASSNNSDKPAHVSVEHILAAPGLTANLSANNQAALSANKQTTHQEFAIVGLAGRYPQADNIDEFWQNLTNNRNCIREITDRYNWQAIYGDPKTEVGKTNIKHFGLMDNIFHFDAAFFSISKREGEVMDPHARLLLEAAWQCVENAGYAPQALNQSKTGVFLAFYNAEFGNLLAQMAIEKASEPYISTSLSGTIKANRISYILGLQGPSEVYDTACSSGLVATHRAMQAISAGDCDQALVGGVSLLLTPDRVVSLSKMGILNESGVCNPFSFPANKEVIGEGVGCMLIKPLSAAEAAGDHIYAVISGSDVNHHGDTSGRLTMPSAPAIAKLMSKTYADVGVQQSELAYIEGHGSGNDSDAVELMAFRQVTHSLKANALKTNALKANELKGENRETSENKEPAPIYVGSVKSNIGFGEASGGIAQLTKLALALNYRLLPATLNFDGVDPSVDLSDTRLAIQTQNVPLAAINPDENQYASAIAYGLGGSNAHILLRSYAAKAIELNTSGTAFESLPIILSANNSDELRRYAQVLFSHLSNNAAQKHYEATANSSTEVLVNIARTLIARDRAGAARIVLLASSYGNLLSLLKQVIDQEEAIDNESVNKTSAKETRHSQIVLPSSEAAHDANESNELLRMAQAWVQEGATRKRSSKPASSAVNWLSLFGTTEQSNKPASYRTIPLPAAPFSSVELKLPMLQARVADEGESGVVEANRGQANRKPLGSAPELVSDSESDLVSQSTESWLAERMHIQALNESVTRVSITLYAHDYFIAQHVVDGTPVLPGAAYLALLGEVSKALYSSDSAPISRATVNNLAFLMPFELPFEQPAKSVLAIDVEASGAFRCFQIKPEQPEQQEILCCKGVFDVPGSDSGNDSGNTLLEHFTPQLKKQTPSVAPELIDADGFWQLTNSHASKQNHGPQMRRLHRLQMQYDSDQPTVKCVASMTAILLTHCRAAHEAQHEAQQEAQHQTQTQTQTQTRAEPQRTQLAIDEFGSEFVLPAAPFLDSALAATVGFAIARNEPQGASVPFSIETAHLLDVIPADKVLYAVVSEKPGKLPRFNISLEDGQGKVYAVILGYFAKSFEQLPVASAPSIKAPSLQASSVKAPSVKAPSLQELRQTNHSAELTNQQPHPITPPENHTRQAVGETVSEQSLASFLVNQFRQMIATFLKLDIEEVPVDEGLEYLGLDSIAVNELTDQVSSTMVIEVPATLMFEYTCIQDMAEYLAEEYEEELMAAFADELKGVPKEEPKEEPKEALAAAPTAAAPTHVQSASVNVAAPSSALNERPVSNPISTAIPAVNTSGEVAVVGMGGLYPGAENVHDFWEKLRTGSDLISELPASRRGMVYGLFEDDMTELPCLFGGFVENSDYFDADFFGFTEEETLAMDPQQRLFLIASWQALEDAGYYPMSFAGQNIGVYAGAIICEYLQLITLNHFNSSFIGTGCALSGIANRTSYFFDLNGPSQTLDSACCSSLYAIDRAVIDINAGVCDAAIVGGVSYIATPYGFNAYQAMDYLSDDWRCKAFGANGDGWSKGELFAAVFLKPLAKAEQDNDHIYAVIKATGTNHGGKSHFYEQPNSNKHAELIKNVYRKANVDPRHAVHIEAHGTGTEMGDALEFNVLSKSLKELAKEQQLPLTTNYCGLGSIKSNVGHSEAAAGISGFIKSVLMLHHQTLAPTLHAQQPNQHIRLQKSPLFIANEAMTPEQREMTPEQKQMSLQQEHIASVHSFNFSGAAAHVVVAGYQSTSQSQTNPNPHQGLSRLPLCVSAKTPEQLHAYLLKLSDFVQSLNSQEQVPFDQVKQIVTTINRSKSHFDHRMAWVVSSFNELHDSLQQAASLSAKEGDSNTTVTFNFRCTEMTTRSAKKVAQYPALSDANAEALIELWLQEPNFDWSQVLGNDFAKLPLPTYPFDMSRAYLPPDCSPTKSSPKKDSPTKNAAPKTAPEMQSSATSAKTIPPVNSKNVPLSTKTASTNVTGANSRASSGAKSGANSDVSQFVRQTLAGLFEMPWKDVDLNLPMNAMPFDSLRIVSLSEALNRQYGLSTTPPDFFAFEQLNEIVELVLELADDLVGASPTDQESKADSESKASSESAAFAEPVSSVKHTEDSNCSQNQDQSIAIIGVSAALPGAANMESFWEVLRDGKDCIDEVPADRWNWQAMWGDPTQEVNKCNVKWAGFIHDVHGLDASFFEISPREAMLMDPQQRLLLTHAWQVLEDAGYAPSSLANSNTAVVVGIGHNGYEQVLIDAGFDIDGHSATGLSASIGSNRISYFLNLHGPSESIDTACSSSLVAIHRAVRLLRSGETPLAIAGGVNALVNKDVHASLNRAGMLSLDGRCKTFSDNANGYARGEGVGLVLLKPLAQAQADGDHIYAVIRGSAENHGGRANSLTAPNPKAQAALLQAAYEDAGFDPATVGYIEAHGTGTELGDPIEINGLKTAFSQLLSRSDNSAAANIGIGSVKTNIGHLEVAAGVAGLVKVLLQFKHKTLAKTLHCDTVNPYIRLDKSPFFVVQEQQAWLPLQNSQGEDLPLRAGVSSFGFGGANAHLVLEEYVAPVQVSEQDLSQDQVQEPKREIILLSAKTPAQLQQQAKNLLDFVDSRLSDFHDSSYKQYSYTETTEADSQTNSHEHSNPNTLTFASLAYTLRVGRDEMSHRLAFTASSPTELVLILESYLHDQNPAQELGRIPGSLAQPSGSNEATQYFTGNTDTQDELLSRFTHDEDFSELLQKWLANNKTDKLLALWVKGLDIPWQSVQSQSATSASVTRMPLPTYPFTPRSFAPVSQTKPAPVPNVAASPKSNAVESASAEPAQVETERPDPTLDADAFLGLDSVAEWVTQKQAKPAKASLVQGASESSESPELITTPEAEQTFSATPLAKPRISLGAPVDKLATALDEVPTIGAEPAIEAQVKAQVQAQTQTQVQPQEQAPVVPIQAVSAQPDLDQLADQLAEGLASALYIDVSDIEYDKSFVELGLDSILAVEWVRWINKHFSIDFPVMKLYDHPNIYALAAFVASQQPQTPVQIQSQTQSQANLPSVESETLHATQPASASELAMQAEQISDQASAAQLALSADHSVLSATGSSATSEDFLNEDTCRDMLQTSLAQALYVEVDDIDLNKPFNELGLDSIIAVEWVRSINATFAMSMPVTKIYDYPTVSLLAGLVSKEGQASEEFASMGEPSMGKPSLGENLLGKARAETVLAQEITPSAQNKTVSANQSLVRTQKGQAEKAQALKTPALDVKAVNLNPVEAGSATTNSSASAPTGLVISSVHTLDEISLREWHVPAPQADEITLSVRASAINFPDTLCVNGLYPTIPAYPFVPGFEVAGVVTQVGANVRDFAIGDEVIAVTGDNLGGHAQIVNVPAASSVRKPRNISFEQACSLPVVFGTVFAAFEMAHLQPGEKVLIQTATGGCGLMALQLANLKNCEIFGTTSKPEKQQILAQLGVPHVLDYTAPNGFDQHIAQLTQGNGVDVVLNMLSGEAIQRGLNCLGASGRYLELAVHGLKTAGKLDFSRLTDNQQFLSMDFRKKALQNQQSEAKNNDINVLAAMVSMVEAGLIVPVVSRVYPYAQIQQALAYVSRGEHIGKVVISHQHFQHQHQQLTQVQDYTQDCIAAIAQQAKLTALDWRGFYERTYESAYESTGEKSASNNTPVAPLKAVTPENKHIAVIGMAGQFPQSPDLEQYWQNIANGTDCITQVPDSRWSVARYFDADPQAPGKSNCAWMGVLDNADKFDPLFFAISPAEAKYMDPQQRLFLQACWHCIEDADINPDALSGQRVGVFVGCTTGQYGNYDDADELNAQGLMGGNTSILTSRISYFLNLKGPSIAIDTACSASLVAISEAANNLVLGNCEMALAGGVSVICGPNLHVMTTKAGMLSPDGRCFTFDNRANGFVPGEGVGVVLLKPLQAALEQGDPIHGVIAGWGVNQDGKTNGITAPSASSQAALEQQVYRDFGISPDTISLVEAHGTGTKLGDPIEVEALKESYAVFTKEKDFCALGSVKANIGHTLAAAGVSGFLKALLALKNKQLPPVASYQQQNEHIALDNTPFYVNTQLRDWPAKTINGQPVPRRATVSSFAFSGTNAHVVLQEAPQRAVKFNSAGKELAHIIVLSARTHGQLQQQQQALASWLAANPNTDLLALSVSLSRGRKHFAQRAAFVASSVAQLQQMLAGDMASPACFTGSIRDKTAKTALVQKLTQELSPPSKQTSHSNLKQLKAALETRLHNSATDSPARIATLSQLAQGYCLGVFTDLTVSEDQNTAPLVRLSLPVYPFAQESYWLENAPNETAKSEPVETAKADSAHCESVKSATSVSLFSVQLQQREYWSGTMLLASLQSLLASKQLQVSNNGVASGWSLQQLDLSELQLTDLAWGDDSAVNAVANAQAGSHLGSNLGSFQESAPISKLHLLPFSARFVSQDYSTQEGTNKNAEITTIHSGKTSLCSLHSITLPVLDKLDIQALCQLADQRQEQQENNSILDAQTCYQHFAQQGVTYPAHSRCIKQVRMNRDNTLVNIRVPHELVGQQDIALMCCFEAVLQACNLALALTPIALMPETRTSKSGFYTLNGLAEMSVYAPLETVMWAKITRADAATHINDSQFDVCLCDANGNIRARLQGLSLRATAQLAANSTANTAAKIKEQPAQALDWMLLSETPVPAPHGEIDWQQAVAALAQQRVCVVYSNEAQKAHLQAIAQPLLAHANSHSNAEESAHTQTTEQALDNWQFIASTEIENSTIFSSAPDVVLVLGADRSTVSLNDSQQQSYTPADIAPVFHTVKTLLRKCWSNDIRCYYLFQQNAQQSAVDLQALSGLLSTACLENARHVWKLLNVSVESSDNQSSLQSSLQQTMQELLSDALGATQQSAQQHPKNQFFQHVRFDHNQRYLLELQEQEQDHSQSGLAANTRPIFKPQGTYLLVGGLGPIGELVCQYLASEYQANLLILSRGDVTPAKQDQMQDLRNRGASVTYYQADVTHPQATESAMVRLLQDHTLNGVILLANQVQDEILVNKQWHDFNHNIQTKIQSCTLIDQLTATQPLDCFLLFSSIAAFGIPGSSDYAYGSAFQNAFARYRNRLAEQGERSGVASSLCWGPWTVDYYLRQSDSGLSVSSGADDEPERLLKFKRQGTDLITSQAAPQVFDNLSLCEQGVVGAVAVSNRDIFRQIMGLTFSDAPQTKEKAEAKSEPETKPDSPFEQQLQSWEQAIANGEALSLAAVKGSLSMDEIKVLPPELIHRLHAVLNVCQSGEAAAEPAQEVSTQDQAQSQSQTNVAQVVAEVVSTVLELPSIDNDEPFQNYGMDSIVAMQLVSRLEKQLNMDIQPGWLVDYPTVDSFANYLASQQTNESV